MHSKVWSEYTKIICLRSASEDRGDCTFGTTASRIGSKSGSFGIESIACSDNSTAEEGSTERVGLVSGSDTVIGPVPKIIQSKLYSGKVSLSFLTKSKLGLFRPDKRWETFEGWMPTRKANSAAVKFFALMMWAILSFISEYSMVVSSKKNRFSLHFRFTKVNNCSIQNTNHRNLFL